MHLEPWRPMPRGQYPRNVLTLLLAKTPAKHAPRRSGPYVTLEEPEQYFPTHVDRVSQRAWHRASQEAGEGSRDGSFVRLRNNNQPRNWSREKKQPERPTNGYSQAATSLTRTVQQTVASFWFPSRYSNDARTPTKRDWARDSAATHQNSCLPHTGPYERRVEAAAPSQA